MKSVRESLSSKCILLTGSTGFLGKVFLERVLRSCPEVSQIYLLVRAVDENHSLERLETDIFSSSIFEKLKEERGSGFREFLRGKISFITGDTSQPKMGISAVDQVELLTKVDFLVNSAASTDFMDRLDDAVSTNTLSVANLIDFVRMSEKARLLHVSTCYVSESEIGVVPEKANIPSKAAQKLRWFKKDDLDLDGVFLKLDGLVRAASAIQQTPLQLKERLINLGSKVARSYGWYNVYTFTKWLGERVLLQRGHDIHSIILRPSIIESSLSEPSPGWIEGLKVADPVFYGFGTGLINYFPGRKESSLDLVPVDVVSNALLLCLAELAEQEKPQVRIYQVCSSDENPLKIGRLIPYLQSGFGRQSVPRRILIPRLLFFGFFGGLNWAQRFAAPILKKLKFVRLHQRAERSKTSLYRFLLLAKLYTPYVTIRCSYTNAELLSLHARAAAEDRLKYPVSTRSIDWEKYICDVHIPGLMKYVIKKNEAPKMKPKNEAVRRRELG